ncbi:MAG: GAF domain-containing protein [Rhodobacteraceae bacterium]|nr:GAF domain-containing protein [Paracoccaceae bacterium]
MGFDPIATDGHLKKIQSAVEGNLAGHSAIVASWRRSLLHHGILAERDKTAHVLTESELSDIRLAQDRLMYVARPILEDLFQSVGLSGFTVVLSDRNGVLIDQISNDYDEPDFQSAGLKLGSVWAESHQGTNAIGTVAVEQRPMVVVKDQHYMCSATPLTCVGAPIFDPSGQVTAVLDVTSARADTDVASAQFLLPIITTTANRIESEYFRACFETANIFVAKGYSNIGTPLLAADDDDLVVGANRAARKLLKIKGDFLERGTPRRDLLNRAAQPRGLEAAERSAIKRAIARNDGIMSKAAKDLGVSRATFYRMLDRHGLKK